MRLTATRIALAIFVLIALASCHSDSTGGPSTAQVVLTTPTAIAGPTAAPHADLGDDDLGVIADAEPDSGQVPLRVRFSVEMAVDEEVENATYTWDFGD